MVSESAAKIPPVCSQRDPCCALKIDCQSNSPGASCETAVLPRSEQPKAADAKAAFGKIQSIANLAPHSVIWLPENQLLIDAALQHQIFHQPSHRIVGQCRGNRGAQSKTAA